MSLTCVKYVYISNLSQSTDFLDCYIGRITKYLIGLKVLATEIMKVVFSDM
jgi:hypothetical protein